MLTRKDFMGNHEWCFYGWREGSGHKFFGPNNATDVWSVKKVSPNKMVHLTEKPVELAVRAMQYSSRSGENVLDLFGGSGSTLIAAEQTGRKAFLRKWTPPIATSSSSGGKSSPEEGRAAIGHGARRSRGGRHMIYLASPYSHPDADVRQQRFNRPAGPRPR